MPRPRLVQSIGIDGFVATDHDSWEMAETLQIAFELKARVAGKEITSRTVGLSLFNRFNHEVEHFIAGSERGVSLDEAHVSVEDGSYRLVVMLPALIAATVEPDMGRLQAEDSLDQIDARRAKIVRGWQERARREDGYQVRIESLQSALQPVRISRETDYHAADQDRWVAVERYVLGRVVDIGGSTEANVHLVLEDTGKRIKATSTEEYLRDQRENYLYHKVQLQIAAHENIQTGELRDVRLLAFVGEGPSYDERELEALIEKGTRAWSDVPDSAAWVREQRGSFDE